VSGAPEADAAAGRGAGKGGGEAKGKGEGEGKGKGKCEGGGGGTLLGERADQSGAAKNGSGARIGRPATVSPAL